MFQDPSSIAKYARAESRLIYYSWRKQQQDGVATLEIDSSVDDDKRS